MSDEGERLRRENPNWDRIMTAVREAKAGLPVTQYTADTNEPITVIHVPWADSTVVMAGDRFLLHLGGPDRDPTKPRTVSVHKSRVN